MLKDNIFVPTVMPQRPAALKLVKEEKTGRNRRRLYFQSTGSHHQTLYIKRRDTADERLKNPSSTCCSHVVEWSFYRPESQQIRESLYRSLKIPSSPLVRKHMNESSRLGPLYAAQQLKNIHTDEYFVFWASGLPDDKDKPSAVVNTEPDYTAADPIAHLFPAWKNERTWSFWLEIRDVELIADNQAYEGPSSSKYSELHLALAQHYFDDHAKDRVLNEFRHHLPDYYTAIAWESLWESHVY
jgi:hypothetical protein